MEKEAARGVASLHVHANAKPSAQLYFHRPQHNEKSKRRRESEQLSSAAAFSAELDGDGDKMDGDEDKKGFPTKQQPPTPQISCCKVSGVLRGARALMYHLLGASWHVLLPAAHWGKIAVTQI